MRTVIIFLCLLMGTFSANADVWIIVDTETKEIVSLSNQDDAQLEPGWEKIIIPGKLKDIELQHHSQYYKYQNGIFIVNIQKLSNEALAQEEAMEISQEEIEVREWLRNLGIDELEKTGKVFKHIKKK